MQVAVMDILNSCPAPTLQLHWVFLSKWRQKYILTPIQYEALLVDWEILMATSSY